MPAITLEYELLTGSVIALGATSNSSCVGHIDNNSIKINLVTSKPYSSQVCVLNKGNNKYVILLPETENKITNNPLTHELLSLLKM